MKKKIEVSGSADLTQTPFSILKGTDLPSMPPVDTLKEKLNLSPPDRGRVNILRVKAGRGGKTVTLVKDFKGIGLPERSELAKKIQRICGCGGTVKNGIIEIQGDKREEAAKILRDAGFTPVFAGG